MDETYVNTVVLKLQIWQLKMGKLLLADYFRRNKISAFIKLIYKCSNF